jgi:hypothetical protein
MLDQALAAEISFIDCTEVIKEYVFACQAIHISVAEAKEKRSEGTRLGGAETVGGR